MLHQLDPRRKGGRDSEDKEGRHGHLECTFIMKLEDQWKEGRMMEANLEDGSFITRCYPRILWLLSLDVSVGIS